ncbi:unnamed protein product [Lactuca virosa]|uniref:Uncharacterized protein n=1 Tax=Lactuca virosa TaxID=75947 RepID=A0AAU9M684_9ASTR|nr:unnamed protein product [Lactuca virosa]
MTLHHRCSLCPPVAPSPAAETAATAAPSMLPESLVFDSSTPPATPQPTPSREGQTQHNATQPHLYSKGNKRYVDEDEVLLIIIIIIYSLNHRFKIFLYLALDPSPVFYRLFQGFQELELKEFLAPAICINSY